MTDDVFDLGAYLGRIGYTGPTDPTLTTLAGIVAAHSATIPFENFEIGRAHV